MRRQLLILSTLVLITGLCIQPGVAWQEPIKAPSSDTVQSAVEPAVPSDAAALTGPPAAVQNANATSPAALVAKWVEAAVANVRWLVAEYIPDDDDNIYLRHIRTYDLPQNEGKHHQPRKVFVLELQVSSAKYRYYDIMLETNAGFGILRDILSTESNPSRLQHLEIACDPSAADDCFPEKIVIHEASAKVSLSSEPHYSTERIDILHKLHLNADQSRQLATSAGSLPPAASAKKKSPGILVAYEGEVIDHGVVTILRLTFPPGDKQKYSKVELVTSAGYNYSDEFFKDSRMPDSKLILLLGGNIDKTNPKYVYEDAGAGYPEIFIRDAYAWKNGKKVNLLPYLQKDPFSMIPIHGPRGLLPLGSSHNESLGGNTP